MQPSDGESLLIEPAELWLRQVHPRAVDGEEVQQVGLRLTDADAGKLSGARSSKQTASGAYEERTVVKPGSTAGTWALSVAEIDAQHVSCFDDSALLSDGPKGHSYIDFRPYDEASRRQIRRKLIRDLNRRGRLHP